MGLIQKQYAQICAYTVRMNVLCTYLVFISIFLPELRSGCLIKCKYTHIITDFLNAEKVEQTQKLSLQITRRPLLSELQSTKQ